ncbi:aminoacyl-tRNA deacylase [Pseudogulbenkiania subflava]|uniref:Ala-tRNA(Pro) deacylase n=1 Tax=Pseudogulbenkiania subflava DSM 22618 TaxID=1123014 RepID=A0A1Y6B935_9NEIS|nr:YbaK/EbsC family protein [Pseudogulbenkiania subflava]SME94856.1 Ala-tRNA(Pro) deacylase [Pseudogulbenkiania subflava DSM 22618]
MSISTTLQNCLSRKGSQYDIVHHAHTHSTSETAQVAHVPGDRLAKTVLLADERGYVAAVLPSTFRLDMSELRDTTGRDLELVREAELSALFQDCEIGAVPPVGMAYGMQTYLDESLAAQPDIYFEAGDHEDLIHMRTEQFLNLMDKAERGSFAHRWST